MRMHISNAIWEYASAYCAYHGQAPHVVCKHGWIYVNPTDGSKGSGPFRASQLVNMASELRKKHYERNEREQS